MPLDLVPFYYDYLFYHRVILGNMDLKNLCLLTVEQKSTLLI